MRDEPVVYVLGASCAFHVHAFGGVGFGSVWSPAIADSGVASRACPPTRADRHRDLGKMSDNDGYNTRFRAQLGALDTPRPAQRVEAELPAQPAPLAGPVKDMSADLNIFSAAGPEAVNGSTGQPPAQHMPCPARRRRGPAVSCLRWTLE